jgi:hypothetical protein
VVNVIAGGTDVVMTVHRDTVLLFNADCRLCLLVFAVGLCGCVETDLDAGDWQIVRVIAALHNHPLSHRG